MKHRKKLFSLLLCLALALSVIPLGVSAEAEGQLLTYYGRPSVTVYYGRSFYSAYMTEAGGLIDESYELTCVVGGRTIPYTTRTVEEDGVNLLYFNLDFSACEIGDTGTLTARKAGVGSWSMPVKVDIPYWGLYSSLNPGADTLLSTVNNNFKGTFDYLEAGRRTAYLILGTNSGDYIEEILRNETPDAFELELITEGLRGGIGQTALRITLKEGYTGSQTAVFVTRPWNAQFNYYEQSWSITFTDGQYLMNARNDDTSLSIGIGSGSSFLLCLPDRTMVTPNDFDVWVTGGTVNAFENNGNTYFYISIGDSFPGRTETLSAKRKSDGAVFSMPVQVTVPYEGLFSSPERRNESYLDYFGYAAGANQASFRYSAEQRSVYLCVSFPIAELLGCETLPAGSGEIISAESVGGKAVKLTLSGKVSEGVYIAHLRLKNNYNYNNNYESEYYITFSDGHALLALGRGALFLASPSNREPGNYESWSGVSVTDDAGSAVLPQQYPNLSINGDDVGAVQLTAERGLNWNVGAPGRSATVRVSSADGSDWRELLLVSTLPGSGFFDAPEKRAEHYLTTGSHSGYYSETEGRTVYYFAQASASDLVIDEASVDGYGVPISVERVNGGECLKISLDDGANNADFATMINYRGTAFNREWEGSASVAFRQKHLHELVWVSAREPSCDQPGWEGHWQCAACGQVFEGPEIPCAASEDFTRASLMQYLVSALNLTAEELENPFSDVTEDMPEYEAILICYKLKIVNGISQGQFAPDAKLTRAQAAVMICRALDAWANGNEPLPPDVPEGHWAKLGIVYCVEHELMSLDDAGNFKPEDLVKVGDVNLCNLAYGHGIRDWTGRLWHNPLGHDLEHFDAVEPGYDSDGCIDHYLCHRCGKYLVPAVNQWGEQFYRELSREQVIRPSQAAGILQLSETEVAVSSGGKVAVSVPLDNVTDRLFRGKVLAAVFLDGKFLGVDVVDVELQPGETTDEELEIQILAKLGRTDHATVCFFLLNADFAPVASPQETEVPPVGEDAVYAAALGEYERLLNAAEQPGLDTDERFVRMAKAEAALLDSAVIIPTTTQGGTYSMSRVAPRTTPYVQWGSDSNRLSGLVISDSFLTKTEREELLAQWARASKGQGTYDPAAYLKQKGHTILSEYAATCSMLPVTLDWLNSSSSADSNVLVQTVAGLVQYDAFNQMQPMLAESWELSGDGLTYTFHIRPGVYWYTSTGAQYAELTAQDFVSGFRHMLDCQAGLEWLVEGVVAGAGEYLYEGGSFDAVGYQATDKYTLTVTLARPASYFLTMLGYSCFLPVCTSFYEAHGGVFGLDEYAETCGDTNAYTYGKSTDVSSQVYCGPFLLQKLDHQNGEIVCVRNAGFFANSETTLDRITWCVSNGEDPNAVYDQTVAGKYAGISLSGSVLDRAKQDGNLSKYGYISETSSTSYFGGLNLNRGTYALSNGACASPQDGTARESTHAAMQNRAFRQALQFAFDKASYNAVSRGEELKLTNLRNMWTAPDFVSLSKAVTLDGKTFAAGTFYGEMVQYYLEQLGSPVRVADGTDGWYNPGAAQSKLIQAKRELGNSVSWPVQIDVVYYSASEFNTVQALAYKQSVERTLGAENVRVNLVAAANSNDYYASGYRAASGAEANYDMFYGSGWGPDYGDPSTYLDVFLSRGAGYMTKVLGLY